MLQPAQNDILTSIYQELRNPGVNTTLDEPFVVPPYAVRVNCFLFAGLFASMLVATTWHTGQAMDEELPAGTRRGIIPPPKSANSTFSI